MGSFGRSGAAARREVSVSARGNAYIFDNYRLEPDHGLLRDGKLLHMPPKELALLQLLLWAEGAIVSIEQIEDELWPRQIVSSASIARCVYSLRKILDDNDRNYVVTEHRRGYRFAGSAIRVIPASVAVLSGERHAALAYYEEGMREASRSQDDAHARAIGLFEEALRIDPEFLEPLTAIAHSYVFQILRGYLSPREGSRLGQAACNTALARNPSCSAALVTKGWFLGVVDRNSDGLVLIERALRLDPDNFQGHSHRAHILRGAGRHHEAVSAARTAAKLNPFMLLQIRPWTFFCAGLTSEALEAAREAQRIRPYMDVTNSFLAVIAAWCGHTEEALEAGRRAAEISRRNPTILTALGYVLARAGDHQAARELAGEIAASTLPRAARSHLAAVYAEIGELDEAFECLREARAEGCPYFAGSGYDPRLAVLMEDARVRALYD